MRAQDTSFTGDWTYRSFNNVVAPVQKLDDILFGEGQMQLRTDDAGALRESTLSFGEDYPMNIQGAIVDSGPGAPPTVKLTAYGVAGTKTAGWVYSYIGSLAPTWPYGVNQVTAIVGTVIRVVPHDGKPAGVVASFVAVKH